MFWADSAEFVNILKDLVDTYMKQRFNINEGVTNRWRFHLAASKLFFFYCFPWAFLETGLLICPAFSYWLMVIMSVGGHTLHPDPMTLLEALTQCVLLQTRTGCTGQGRKNTESTVSTKEGVIHATEWQEEGQAKHHGEEVRAGSWNVSTYLPDKRMRKGRHRLW